MAESLVGKRIRKLRLSRGIGQKVLAGRVGISASYLNMIEIGSRPIAGRLLASIADELDVELAKLNGQAEAQTSGDLADLLVTLGDALSADIASKASNSIDTLATDLPEWAEVMVQLHNQNSAVRALASRLQDQASFNARLTDIGHKILQHLTTVRSSASILKESAKLSDQARTRFGDIVERESQALEEMSREFFDRLEVLGQDQGPLATRREIDNVIHTNLNYFEALEALAEIHPRGFGETFDTVTQRVRRDLQQNIEGVTQALCYGQGPGTQNALYLYLEQYLSASIMMPYTDFAEAADQSRYDIDALAQHFQVSFEQAAHRLTTLRRTASLNVAFSFMKVDAAGNVLKSLSLPEFYVPTSGATCPKWPIFNTSTHGGSTAAYRLNHDKNGSFLAIAKQQRPTVAQFGTETRLSSIMLVCRWEDAPRTAYFEAAKALTVNAGTSCTVCQFPNCPSRLRQSLMPS